MTRNLNPKLSGCHKFVPRMRYSLQPFHVYSEGAAIDVTDKSVTTVVTLCASSILPKDLHLEEFCKNDIATVWTDKERKQHYIVVNTKQLCLNGVPSLPVLKKCLMKPIRMALFDAPQAITIVYDVEETHMKDGNDLRQIATLICF